MKQLGFFLFIIVCLQVEINNWRLIKIKKFPKKTSLILSITLIGFFNLFVTASASDSTIPDWIKNNAKWWAEGSITESDYIRSLEYMITNGIIHIPIPITEVTAAQTALTEEERAQSFKVTISDITAPISVNYFEKFEIATSHAGEADDPRGRMYDFRDVNPKFFLESLPSADKNRFYEFIGDWMDKRDLNEFDVEIDVLDGTGGTIQIWDFNKCEITSYGTYLQDTIFIYQFSGVQDSEIRDRTHFSCVGVHLRIP